MTITNTTTTMITTSELQKISRRVRESCSPRAMYVLPNHARHQPLFNNAAIHLNLSAHCSSLQLMVTSRCTTRRSSAHIRKVPPGE